MSRQRVTGMDFDPARTTTRALRHLHRIPTLPPAPQDKLAAFALSCLCSAVREVYPQATADRILGRKR